MLEVDCRNDNGAVCQSWIRQLQCLLVHDVYEVHDPSSMAGDEVERLVYEGLGHGMTKVSETHGEEKGMVKQARDGCVDDLHEKVWSPIPALLMKGLG